MPQIIEIEKSFLIALTISFMLVSVPIPGRFLRGVNTLIHELGHALAAFLTRGELIKIELFSDTSGMAITRSKTGFGQFIISLAGYTTASATAYIYSWSVINSHFNLFYFSLAIIAILSALFAVRNPYGILWLILFAAATTFTVLKADTEIVQYIAVFVTSLMLTESLLSTFRLFSYTLKNSKIHSDALNLSKITKLPALFWAVVFCLQAIFFSLLSVELIFNIELKSLLTT